MAALSQAGPRTLELRTSVACPYSITLPPGFVLTGKDKDTCILMFGNGDGIGLTADNCVANLTIAATPAARAIYTQTGFADMGKIALENLSVTGQVSIVTRSETDKLNLVVDKVHIAACDARRYSEQPQKYGVNVYQGALTVYNFNGNAKSTIITHGSVGNTLVKGVNMLLPAEAFSVKPGGVVDKLVVKGDLVTHGAKVVTYAVEGGKVNAVDIQGRVLAHGRGSNAVLVGGGSTPLTNVRAKADKGEALVVKEGDVTDKTRLSACFASFRVPSSSLRPHRPSRTNRGRRLAMHRDPAGPSVCGPAKCGESTVEGVRHE